MKKQLQKFFAKKKNNKGFTLIELIIVIAILAILIGIVGMASIRYVEKSRKSADEQTLDSISTAAQAALVDPDLGITIKDKEGKIMVKDSAIKATGFTGNIETEITNSLAKAPKLNSQAYKNGRKLTITVGTGTDAAITVGNWEDMDDSDKIE